MREPQEFKQLTEVISMKYHQIGEGNQPKLGEVVEMQILLTATTGDTLHYVPNYPYFFKLGKSELDKVIASLTKGDSITLRLPRREINKQFKFYKILQSDEGEVDFHFSLKNCYAVEKAKEIEQKKLSYREIKEQETLIKYLQINGEDSLNAYKGIYRRVSGTVTGDSIKFGSEVSIHYTGSFLSGYTFDDTYEKGITPTFTYGKEHQLIEGLQIGLEGVKEGERVKIILPSRRAFGEQGSLAGIVPPYTAVMFEIKILKVKN